MIQKFQDLYNKHLSVKIVTVVIVVFLTAVIMLPLVQIAEQFGVDVRNHTGLNFQVSFGHVFFFFLFGICSILIIALAQRFIHREKLTALGFKPNAASTVLLGFVLGALLVSSKFTIMLFSADVIDLEPVYPPDYGLAYIGYYLYFLFGFIFWNALIEELTTRAYPIEKLKDHMNPHVIFTIMGLIFAGGHLLLNAYSTGYFLSLFIASYIYSLLYYYSGSIWLTIGMHSGVNWVGFTIFGTNWKLGALVNIEIIGGNPWIMDSAGVLTQLLFLGIIILMKRKGYFNHHFQQPIG